MYGVSVQFVKAKNWASKIIGWTDTFSHMDIVMKDGQLLGARSDKVGGQLPGVRIRPPNYMDWEVQMLLTIPCTAEQEIAFYAAAISQLGLPYDRLDILGFITDEDWFTAQHWICSALGVYCGQAAKILPQYWMSCHRFDPGMAATAYASQPEARMIITLESKSAVASAVV